MNNNIINDTNDNVYYYYLHTHTLNLIKHFIMSYVLFHKQLNNLI